MQSSKTIFHCTKQYKKTGLKWALNAESTLVNGRNVLTIKLI